MSKPEFVGRFGIGAKRLKDWDAKKEWKGGELDGFEDLGVAGTPAQVASQPQETAATPEAAPEPPAEPDDLKKLEGIGPKVASLLNENGMPRLRVSQLYKRNMTRSEHMTRKEKEYIQEKMRSAT